MVSQSGCLPFPKVPPKKTLKTPKVKTALLRWKRRFHCSELSRRLVQPRAAMVALVALVALVVWGDWAGLVV